MGWQYGATRALVSRQSSLWVVIKQDYPRGCRMAPCPFARRRAAGRSIFPCRALAVSTRPQASRSGARQTRACFQGGSPPRSLLLRAPLLLIPGAASGRGPRGDISQAMAWCGAPSLSRRAPRRRHISRPAFARLETARRTRGAPGTAARACPAQGVARPHRRLPASRQPPPPAGSSRTQAVAAAARSRPLSPPPASSEAAPRAPRLAGGATRACVHFVLGHGVLRRRPGRDGDAPAPPLRRRTPRGRVSARRRCRVSRTAARQGDDGRARRWRALDALQASCGPTPLLTCSWPVGAGQRRASCGAGGLRPRRTTAAAAARRRDECSACRGYFAGRARARAAAAAARRRRAAGRRSSMVPQVRVPCGESVPCSGRRLRSVRHSLGRRPARSCLLPLQCGAPRAQHGGCVRRARVQAEAMPRGCAARRGAARRGVGAGERADAVHLGVCLALATRRALRALIVRAATPV